MFTVGVLKAFGWLVFVSIAAVTYTVRTSDRIRTAVPAREFQDTTLALRRDIRAIAIEAKEAAVRTTSISCYIAKYPAGLCDDVPLAQRRRSP